MPALCSMLSGTYYAQNYVGIIGRSLSMKKMHERSVYGSCYVKMISTLDVYHLVHKYNSFSYEFHRLVAKIIKFRCLLIAELFVYCGPTTEK